MASGKLQGKRIKRVEDPRLLSGKGRFISDVTLPGMASIAFVRSPFGHARVESIDLEEALGSPGVLAVWTGEGISQESQPLESRLHETPGLEKLAQDCKTAKWFPLALERVRYMGEAVVAIVAENRYLAEDAAEKVQVEFAPLPAVNGVEEALLDGATLLHEDWGTNLMLTSEFQQGDPDQAFRDADTVVEETFTTSRCTSLSIETRGGIADYDLATGQLSLWSSSQVPHMVRMILPELIDVPENKLRVVAPDIGGGFGTKGQIYPEDLVVCIAAKKLGRPVKWIEDRLENLQSSSQARQGKFTVEMAAQKDGTILGLRAKLVHDAGAYPSFPFAANESIHIGMILPGPYRIRNYEYTMYNVVTNKSPLGPYRGVGAPMATYMGETLLDSLARRLGLDPVDIRLKNLVREDEFPYTSATGLPFENGSFIESLKRGAELLNYQEFRKEQKQARAEGRYIGLGIANYVEGAAPGSGFFALWDASGFDTITLRMTPSATVIVETGMACTGQGYETTLAQIVADELSVDINDVTVSMGDTTNTPFSWGSHSSRFAVVCGGACLLAARQVKEDLLSVAARYFGTQPGQVDIANNCAFDTNHPDRQLPLKDVCKMGMIRPDLLPGGGPPVSLESTQSYEPPPLSTPNAAHFAVVEVDAETGTVQILRYQVVHDCGTILNPMIVEGQIRGGTAQGIGNALYEKLDYTDEGQLLTGSLMDYTIPTSATTPSIDIAHLETPSPNSLNGCKGMGEGGAIAAPGAIANAVADALSPFGIVFNQLPITPEIVWQKLKSSTVETPN